MNFIAHRALDNNYKENTMEAILDCITKLYIKGIEIDIRLTKDNNLVIIHDSTINRTSDGYEFVKNMKLKQLKKYNFGTKEIFSKIPTLKEVLMVYPNNKILLIEIKCTKNEKHFLKIFCKTIKKYQNKNIYVMSFNKKIIELLKKESLNIRCGILLVRITNKKELSKFDFIAISSYSINEVKNFNKTLFIWAINNVKRYYEIKKELSEETFFIVNYPKRYIKHKK